MAAAGARGALENVAINLESITDADVHDPPEIRSSGYFGASRRGIRLQCHNIFFGVWTQICIEIVIDRNARYY